MHLATIERRLHSVQFWRALPAMS